ncbi:hypothetical protein ASE11_07925 [Hydrogenophaga sp. Root209]|uniref:hypothetical protein n=1 Tax=unclassified Hydrogenophaga TaxID=2610897 RepID=UPI0006F40A40|nr:hypothetical protein [Hydrogenophaga sp. Root209]KRB99611.1 hypothetical protein ASE11_07925 [Hydrogenophaga sp. Root209]
MPSETALFWLVVAAFLFFDNLIIVPRGCDLLRFGRRGVLRYDASSRLTAAGKEMVMLNPLNLFDRGLVTTECFGDVDPRQWKQGRLLVSSALPTLNGFSSLGYAYLVIVIFLAALSFRIGFTPALIGFIVLHLVVWVAALAVLITRRHQLQLSGSAVLGAAAEALFVPAYLMNLGKRLTYKKRVAISALGLGLRELKRVVDGDDREEFTQKLSSRMDMLEMTQGYELDEASTEDASPWDTRAGDLGAASSAVLNHLSITQQWIMEARGCLKT